MPAFENAAQSLFRVLSKELENRDFENPSLRKGTITTIITPGYFAAHVDVDRCIMVIGGVELVEHMLARSRRGRRYAN